MQGGRILPKKGLHRMRAHVNPFSRNDLPFPPHHSYVDWQTHFPAYFGGTTDQNLKICCNTSKYPAKYNTPRAYPLQNRSIDILDIGCGYGGLLFALAPLYPQQLILGLQIREKIADYVGQKIRGYRVLHPGSYDNIGVVRTNTIRYLCNYIPRGSVSKIFLCFPDPHFKTKAYKRRITNTGFLSQYAYLLKPQGRLYCITDVEELHQWQLSKLQHHGMLAQAQEDQCVQIMRSRTQQSLKVARRGGSKYWSVFQKKCN